MLRRLWNFELNFLDTLNIVRQILTGLYSLEGKKATLLCTLKVLSLENIMLQELR